MILPHSPPCTVSLRSCREKNKFKIKKGIYSSILWDGVIVGEVLIFTLAV